LFHTNVLMDGLVIENVHGNPIAARYSDVTLINSQLRSFITGDLINVKYGKGYIANCRFTGNDQPDTDAIDYDDVENSVIRNCSISGFYGPNSDGIDIGEKALDVLIDSVFVSHVSDKGISVGQQSSVKISNSVFTNCNMGIALKDSCEAYIDYCTFYGNNMAVASYEKNRGDAGGNGFVAYSILSNSYEQSYWCDEFSSIKISNSLSDNDPLPDGANNLLADPLFKNPTFFDFALQSASPGTGHIKNLGAGLSSHQLIPDPMITEIAYLTQAEIDVPEFIAIYNPAAVSIDLSGYRLSKGVTYAFPEGTKLPPGQKFYVSGNSLAEFWEGRVTHLKNWTSGRLADEGESIILENAGRIPIDGVKYNNKAPWPLPDDATLGLRLKSVNVDNHFGANWEKVSIDQMVSVQVFSDEAAAFYPNPFIDRIFITWEGNKETKAEMLDLTGKLVLSFDLQQGINQIQTEALPAGLYLLKAGKISQRILKIP
ncbi:MAG: lamin tail domain-containing protein, partial [Prolixibacteraceae bacterium]|nr:lamin tail domain-containing protein [Prolixibacteraceae bacterium]